MLATYATKAPTAEFVHSSAPLDECLVEQDRQTRPATGGDERSETAWWWQRLFDGGRVWAVEIGAHHHIVVVLLLFAHCAQTKFVVSCCCCLRTLHNIEDFSRVLRRLCMQSFVGLAQARYITDSELLIKQVQRIFELH